MCKPNFSGNWKFFLIASLFAIPVFFEPLVAYSQLVITDVSFGGVPTNPRTSVKVKGTYGANAAIPQGTGTLVIRQGEHLPGTFVGIVTITDLGNGIWQGTVPYPNGGTYPIGGYWATAMCDSLAPPPVDYVVSASFVIDSNGIRLVSPGGGGD